MKRINVVSLALFLAITIAGCGGGGSNTPPPPPALTVTCAPAQIELLKTSQCSVSPAVAGSWSVSQGPGTISSSGLYTAPATLSGGSSATVRFAASDGRSATFTIVITAPPSPGDIVFMRGLQTGNPACGGGFCEDIYVMNQDGSGVRQLTTDTLQDLSPAWSPDKTKIAFVSNRDRTIQVHIMNADGSNQRRVSPSQYSSATDPGWSPDGAKIVFTGQLVEGGDIGITVMNADGTGAVQLTREPCSGGCLAPGHPRFSPDGKRILFHSGKSGNFEVWVMDSDGSNQTNLTANQAVDGEPSWSPDGGRIVFMSNRAGGTLAIYTMNSDGSGVFQVTFPPLGDINVRDVDPSWSPDGAKIVYSGWRILSGNLSADLYIVSSTSGNPTRITSAGFNRYPDWR